MKSSSTIFEPPKKIIILHLKDEAPDDSLFFRKKHFEEQGKEVHLIEISLEADGTLVFSWPDGVVIDENTKILISGHGKAGSPNLHGVASASAPFVSARKLGQLICSHVKSNSVPLYLFDESCHGGSSARLKGSEDIMESFAENLLGVLENLHAGEIHISARFGLISQTSAGVIVSTDAERFIAKAKASKIIFSLNKERVLGRQFPYEKGSKIYNCEDKGKQRSLLHVAAMNNESEKLHTLCEDGFVAMNIRDANARTPLHLAALYGRLEAETILLGKKADPNQTDSNNWTPLHMAAQSGHTGIVQLLCEKNANVEARDCKGWTPLHHAAGNGHVDTVRCLVGNGAHVDARDSLQTANVNVAAQQGRTALHWAVAAPQELREIVELLCDLGASVDAQDSHGSTPLHIAIVKGYPKIVCILLGKGANANIKDSQGWTPLHLAATNNQHEIACILLDKGANANIESDLDGRTPLHIAVTYHHPQTVCSLLDRGADVDRQDFQGRTPLHTAVAYADFQIVCSLLAKGANVNARGSKDQTPLHIATQYEGRNQIIQALISNGSDVEARDVDGRTALHLAAQDGRYGTIQALIKNGANVEAKDAESRTARDIAEQNGHIESMQFLQQVAKDTGDSSRSVTKFDFWAPPIPQNSRPGERPVSRPPFSTI